jgi:hypothetical protein
MAQLPALTIDPRNALLDLSPVRNALTGLQNQQNANREYDQQQEQLGMQRESHALQKQNYEHQWKQQDVANLGKRAQAIDGLTDDRQRQAAWGAWVKAHGADGLSPEEMDYRTGPKLAAAAAGLFRDPMEAEKNRLDMDYKRAQIGALNRRNTAGNGTSPLYQKREEVLARYGVDPKSPEGQMYVFNGKLPAKSYDQDVQRDKRATAGGNISQGLTNLNKLTETYNDAAFENAVGPLQGSTPDNLAGKAAIVLPRLGGEIANMFSDANATPNEVRNNIVGSTEALAAAIKPLIRGPGEGVWTDADQARLVAIVGDLSQSSNKAEYKRRLNAVRDRIKANFGLDVDFDAGGKSAAPQASGMASPKSPEDYAALPSGTRYTAPDGSVRVKP